MQSLKVQAVSNEKNWKPKSSFIKNELRRKIEAKEMHQAALSTALDEENLEDGMDLVEEENWFFYSQESNDDNDDESYEDREWFYDYDGSADSDAYDDSYEDSFYDFDHGSWGDHRGEELVFRGDCEEDFDDKEVIESFFCEAPYEPEPILAPVYERLRFQTNRFDRLPGHKQRWKKSKAMRGGNRRNSVDACVNNSNNSDGSRKIKSFRRNCCALDLGNKKQALGRLVRHDIAEALQELNCSDLKFGGATHPQVTQKTYTDRGCHNESLDSQFLHRHRSHRQRSKSELVELKAAVRSCLFPQKAVAAESSNQTRL